MAQAQRLISATHGSVLVLEKQDGHLETAACFGGSAGNPDPLGPDSRFAASILERCIGEVVNGCDTDLRALDSECMLHALICVPMRAGQRNVGTIALGSSNPSTSYSAGDLKPLNTIALQAAAAIENALLCAEMVESARERAAYAAELQAASTVQQLLLQSASQVTPGFEVESVYLPASEVGGDFFFVAPAPDGSITAVVGDVSRKRPDSSDACRYDSRRSASRNLLRSRRRSFRAQQRSHHAGPAWLYHRVLCPNRALRRVHDCERRPHFSLSLRPRTEHTTGIAPRPPSDQVYPSVHGKLAPTERLVLLSDGVLEARGPDGEIYGFERLPGLTRLTAQQIADIGQSFGQEDDITVLTLSLTPALPSVPVNS